MSLGIVIKGPEGLVLAAESRVTLAVQQGQAMLGPVVQSFQVSFDHATKLLAFGAPHTYVGVVTFGQAVIGGAQPRTPASFIPELEASLPQQRLPVADFAKLLSGFYLQRWLECMPSQDRYSGPDITFIVGGFDKDAPYGRIFQIAIPSAPMPVEQNPDPIFGILWGGQQEIAERLIKGYDPSLPNVVASALGLDGEEVEALTASLKGLQLFLPIGFLALQDCVDLAILLIRTTIAMQQLTVAMRGVGGAIDVATITRQDGLRFVQRKQVRGEP